MSLTSNDVIRLVAVVVVLWGIWALVMAKSGLSRALGLAVLAIVLIDTSLWGPMFSGILSKLGGATSGKKA